MTRLEKLFAAVVYDEPNMKVIIPQILWDPFRNFSVECAKAIRYGGGQGSHGFCYDKECVKCGYYFPEDVMQKWETQRALCSMCMMIDMDAPTGSTATRR